MHVRASYPRSTLARIMELPEGPRAAALDGLHPTTLAELAAAPGSLDWVTGRVHLDLDDRLYEAIGRDGFLLYCRELVVDMSRWSLFLPILAGRLRRPASRNKA